MRERSQLLWVAHLKRSSWIRSSLKHESIKQKLYVASQAVRVCQENPKNVVQTIQIKWEDEKEAEGKKSHLTASSIHFHCRMIFFTRLDPLAIVRSGNRKRNLINCFNYFLFISIAAPAYNGRRVRNDCHKARNFNIARLLTDILSSLSLDLPSIPKAFWLTWIQYHSNKAIFLSKPFVKIIGK